MTFILAVVGSSYRGCEKTFVIPKLCVKFILRSALSQMMLLGQRSRESVRAKSIYAFEILDSVRSTDACSNGMEQCYSRQISYAGKSIPNETFC